MQNFLLQVLEEAKKAGAKADAIINEAQQQSANIYQGELEEYEDSMTCGAGVRVFTAEGRVGYAYSENLSDPQALVQAAVAVAQVSAVDPDETLYQGPFGESATQIVWPQDESSALVRQATALYEETVAYKHVQDTYRCAAMKLGTKKTYASTEGAMLQDGGGAVVVMTLPIVGAGDYREVGFDFAVAPSLAEINTQGIVAKAVERGMRYAQAKTTQTRVCPVIFHGEAMVDLLAVCAPIFSAENAQKGLSQLAGKEGMQVASPAFTLTDASENRQLQLQALFDGEGVPVCTRNIVDNGTLTTLLYDVRSGNRAHRAPTGNAARGYSSTIHAAPNNLVLQPGMEDFAALAKRAQNGVVLYEVSGLHAGINSTSGDFSLLCKGQEIVDGALGGMFVQAVVSGNLYKMLLDVVAVGNDVEYAMPSFHSICSPSVLISSLSIAGS